MGHLIMPPHPEDDLNQFFCAVHETCLEGRVSSLRLNILRNRLGKEKMQEIAAYYIAQFCQVITLVMAPPKIILAGHTITENPCILELVRSAFRDKLTKGYPRNTGSSQQDYITVAVLPVEDASWRGALLAAMDPTHPQARLARR